MFNIEKLYMVLTLCIRVLYGSQNKWRLLLYAAADFLCTLEAAIQMVFVSKDAHLERMIHSPCSSVRLHKLAWNNDSLQRSIKCGYFKAWLLLWQD